jgi:hypothetical protein
MRPVSYAANSFLNIYTACFYMFMCLRSEPGIETASEDTCKGLD